MTKYCKDMCIVCFAPKRYDSQWLYASAEEDAHEVCVSEIGSIYEDLIQISLTCKESGPQYVCNYCKTQLNCFHKFKLKALDAYKKITEESCSPSSDEVTCAADNLVKVEEITVFDVSTKQTEKFEIQYLDEDDEDSADVIEIDETKTFLDSMTGVQINGSSIDQTSSSSKSTTSSAQVVCQLCSKAFESNEAFNVHWKEHEELPQYSCNKCPQKFHSRENYLRHKNIHQKRKTLLMNCGECGKSFLRLYQLKLHMTVHTGERYFECEICHKKFRTNSTLKYHRYSHGEKQFQCEICLQMYTTPQTLREHLKFVHRREFSHICDICNRQFVRRQKLERHRMLHFRSNSRLVNANSSEN